MVLTGGLVLVYEPMGMVICCPIHLQQVKDIYQVTTLIKHTKIP